MACICIQQAWQKRAIASWFEYLSGSSLKASVAIACTLSAHSSIRLWRSSSGSVLKDIFLRFFSSLFLGPTPHAEFSQHGANFVFHSLEIWNWRRQPSWCEERLATQKCPGAQTVGIVPLGLFFFRLMA